MNEHLLSSADPVAPSPRAGRRLPWHEVLLALILAVAALLRFTGLSWDENQHLHPDERFLTMVETGIRLPDTLSGYFDTENSPLNPHNAGHHFFVYGTLPIFLVRVLAEWTGQQGYDQVTLLGRAVSASFDLFSVLLVFLIGRRLYRSRVGLLAAAFYALSVLPIQHAHFFVVESFTTFFVLLGIYFAVQVMATGGWRDYLLFGLALGMAVASKISAAPLAALVVVGGIAFARRAPPEERTRQVGSALLRMAGAAGVALLAFRLFQPYAFAGPGFFGVLPNPRWLANMSEVMHQASGNVDFPPALQWANRAPVLFALGNLVVWGMGAPLGVLAWLGWGWAVVRLLRRKDGRSLLLALWTGGFFLWQSTGFTPAMRYQLPVYPTLALLGSWAFWEAWGWAARLPAQWARWGRIAVGGAGAAVLAATAIWAAAFVSIYVRSMPRVAASRWIYANIPGAVNLVIETDNGERYQPVPLPLEFVLRSGAPHLASFVNQVEGEARAIVIPFVTDLTPELGERRLTLSLQESPDPASTVALATFAGTLPTEGEGRLELPLDSTWALIPGRTYFIHMDLWEGGAISLGGDISVVLSTPEGDNAQAVNLGDSSFVLSPGQPYTAPWTAVADGLLTRLHLPHVLASEGAPSPASLRVTLFEEADAGPADLASAEVSLDDLAPGDVAVDMTMSPPVLLANGGRYGLRFELTAHTALAMRGSTIIGESSWDDGLPLPLDGQGRVGVYGDVLQELYWPDDQDDDRDGISDKLQRIASSLAEGDYLIITSNRQYGTIPRVPIRYPLTTAYYRALFGCSPSESVVACGARAEPGEILGELGYELVATFASHPTLGPLEFNDQLAEEAFTVYDHPKVLIFARSESFSLARVEQILGSVDVSNIAHLLPVEVGAAPPDLLLPEDRLAEQRAGGTWSELFPRDSLVNRSEWIALLAWWVLVSALGLAAFPLLRAALPGFVDGGYPFSRLAGLLIVGWGSWLLGSLRIPFGRASMLAVLALLTAVSAGLIVRRREEWIQFLRSHRREILWTEVLALGFFLLDLAIRLGNPDIWHPSKGGERPMDLSYLYAVLKSTSFPPYDPWFAGGYINYYYYGFVLIAVPIRILGLDPVVAYNLAVPTVFALLALAAYSVGYNLVARTAGRRESDGAWRRAPRWAGLFAAVSMVVLGNLGTVRLIYEALKRLGTTGAEPQGTFIVGAIQAASGALRYLSLESPLPIALDSWYWDPSRAIPPGPGEAGPITEFPFFTFLYGDLHAHMIARPIAVLILGWCLSWLLAAWQRSRLRWSDVLAAFFLGGLALGALRPTNLSDYPTYWGMAAVGVVAAAWLRWPKLERRTFIEAAAGVVALIALASVFYLPYHLWYGQGYGAVEIWQGGTTSLSAYLTVHGVFLFILVGWLAWETRRWMATTPISALSRLRPAFGVIAAAGLSFLLIVAILVARGYPVALFALPLVVWAGLVFFRPGIEVEKRFVLVLVAAAAALTFLVEIVVTVGDISRMNTVFKFYLQVWEMFSLASAGALIWTFGEIRHWKPSQRQVWMAVLVALLIGAALYPITAAAAKIRDRWSSAAPHRLDGMAFMRHVTYHDVGTMTSLAEDEAAIRWLQDNVAGSPVIVEANLPEYRWGSRMTIYTGLPGVLGWNWHQRQQRVVAGDIQVWERAEAITHFYLTRSVEEAQAFLEEYQVAFVVVGQLERMYYETFHPCLPSPDGLGVLCDMSGRPSVDGCYGLCALETMPAECRPEGDGSDPSRLVCPTHGLEKFDAMVGLGLLREAFREADTRIYEVVR